MPSFCAVTADRGYRHFFYGGADGVAEAVIAALKKSSPSLQIAGYYTPPFRPLTPEEDEAVTRQINESKPDFVWVCLGCPKQERWIAEHRQSIRAAALLAVGMAFDTTAGKKKRAPKLLRKLGIEWVHRLFQEPRRLWRRYLVYNSLFVWLTVRELFSAGDSTLKE
jgi:N-acetylglucosaminyldiphosphoundecaprenol N-acetyl-beta-D-mannosaminyltransferase